MNITVHHVELSTIAGQAMYVATCEVEQPGAEIEGLEVQLIPHDTFEAKAGEYAIDTSSKTGWQDLLDLVFYGERLPETAQDQLADPDHLLNAPTVAHARKTRLGRIKAMRGKGTLTGATGETADRVLLSDAGGVVNSGKEDPLEFIRRTAPMSREHLRVRAEFTRRQRNRLRAARAGRNTRDLLPEDVLAAGDQARADMTLADLHEGRESAAELAARLLGPPATEPNQPPATAL